MKELFITNIYVLIKNKYLHILNILLYLFAISSLIMSDNNMNLWIYYTYVVTHIVFYFGIYMYYMISNRVISIQIMNYNRIKVFYVVVLELSIYEMIVIMVFHFIISLREARSILYNIIASSIIYFPLVIVCIIVSLIINNYIISSFTIWFFLCFTGFVYLFIENNKFIKILSATYHLQELSMRRVDYVELSIYLIMMFLLILLLWYVLKRLIDKREYK